MSLSTRTPWCRPGVVRAAGAVLSGGIRMLCQLVVALSLSLVAGADTKEDTLQGTWLASSAEIAGQPWPEELRKSLKLVLKDGKYTVTIGKQPDQGTV